ncbi:MAG TPA: endonuclease domain-containing protein [Xanthobacteraceae bacterium]|jgi:hypothetical protein|nr:endonuclease domain-containing protein [Xanthobacteraceae bacterium]
MSDWNDLPKGFLRLGFNRWPRFEPELRDLIVKLAREQNFRCALCRTDRGLIVEHDHDPYIGEWERPTIYNTRGLVCDRCNRHIDFYEQRERGEDGWLHVNICFSDSEYDDYKYAYEMRVLALWENDLQKRLGHRYWHRRLFVDKFYDWSEERWYEYPWESYFKEIRTRRRWTNHPEEFFKTLLACMKFVAAEIEKNPNYQPPDDFIKVFFRIKPILDELRPIVQAKLQERALLKGGLPA